MTSAHQQPRGINNGRAAGRPAVCKDQKGRPKEASKRTKEGPLQRLLSGLNGEETKKCMAAIKQTINREESKRIRYLIK